MSFESDGDGTLVTLTHSGWERLAEPEAPRDEHHSGWPHVLAGFGRLLEDDASVAREALTVTVQPWDVRFTATS